MPSMAEAFGWCGITPVQFMDHTPGELEMMIKVQKIKAGVEEVPREPMTNPEMIEVAKVIEQAMKLKGGT